MAKDVRLLLCVGHDLEERKAMSYDHEMKRYVQSKKTRCRVNEAGVPSSFSTIDGPYIRTANLAREEQENKGNYDDAQGSRKGIRKDKNWEDVEVNNQGGQLFLASGLMKRSIIKAVLFRLGTFRLDGPCGPCFLWRTFVASLPSMAGRFAPAPTSLSMHRAGL